MKNAAFRKLMLAGVALVSLSATPALANPSYGDQRPYTDSYGREHAEAANWTGPYIGGHGGYAWGDFRGRTGAFGPDGSGTSWLGGLQIGNNWQYRRFILGIEGDASKMDFMSRNGTTTFNEDWMATVRGRAGYAMGQIMPYLTAGAGFTDVISKARGIGSESDVRTGFTGGGGIDFLMADKMGSWFRSGNWVGRVEYLYVDVPRDTVNVGPVPVSGGSHNNVVRVGLNYKF